MYPPLFVWVVWSNLGPVVADAVKPFCLTQLKSSSNDCVQFPLPCSKLILQNINTERRLLFYPSLSRLVLFTDCTSRTASLPVITSAQRACFVAVITTIRRKITSVLLKSTMSTCTLEVITACAGGGRWNFCTVYEFKIIYSYVSILAEIMPGFKENLQKSNPRVIIGLLPLPPSSAITTAFPNIVRYHHYHY